MALRKSARNPAIALPPRPPPRGSSGKRAMGEINRFFENGANAAG
jgi:hypothetical protein